VNLTSYGGVCDGETDNNIALANGLAAARAQGVPLVIPAGQCNFSAVIHLDSAKLSGSGTRSILYATNWQAQAIFMTGASPSLSNLKLTGAAAPSRQSAWETTHVVVFGATDFVIDRVAIEGPAGGGIMATSDQTTGQSATRGRITNNTVRNTVADSIHMTAGANHILVDGNLVESSGDDGIAVVSYQDDGVLVNNITVSNNVVRNNKGGRNLSVVGGSQVTFENNLVQTNEAGFACLYLAQENSFNTYTVSNVNAINNTLQNCGSEATGHAAVTLFTDAAQPNTNITLQRNDIIQNGQDGIRYFGALSNVQFIQNRITGAGNAYVGDNVAGVTVTPYTSGPVGYVAR
jgi:hypothetical protein